MGRALLFFTVLYLISHLLTMAYNRMELQVHTLLASAVATCDRHFTVLHPLNVIDFTVCPEALEKCTVSCLCRESNSDRLVIQPEIQSPC
jgi:hypothetical protein